MNASQQIITDYESHKRNCVGPAFEEMRRFNLMNISALDESKGTRLMYAYAAAAAGRYDGDTSGGVGNMVFVTFTDDEKQALENFRRVNKESNAMFANYKRAKQISALALGKRMVAKFSGKSTLTGETFAAGTEIFYYNNSGDKYVAPVAEMGN